LLYEKKDGSGSAQKLIYKGFQLTVLILALVAVFFFYHISRQKAIQD
jgi:hypothetical protein